MRKVIIAIVANKSDRTVITGFDTVFRAIGAPHRDRHVLTLYVVRGPNTLM